MRLSGLGYTDPFLGSTGNIYFKYRFYLTYNPVDQTEATTKQYVDTSIQNSLANYLPLTGGALTGGLYLPQDPVDNLQATTKQYVDNLFIRVLGNLTTAFNNLSTTFSNYGH